MLFKLNVVFVSIKNILNIEYRTPINDFRFISIKYIYELRDYEFTNYVFNSPIS